MRRLILATCLLGAPAPALAADETLGVAGSSTSVILDLIDENRRTQSRNLVPSVDPELPPVRLWTHVRTPEQEAEADKIGVLLGDGVALGEVTRDVEIRPVQEVDFGPDAGQVRYFYPEDRTTALTIAGELSAAGIDAEARDFVHSFAGKVAVSVGTIEVWLPPEN